MVEDRRQPGPENQADAESDTLWRQVEAHVDSLKFGTPEFLAFADVVAETQVTSERALAYQEDARYKDMGYFGDNLKQLVPDTGKIDIKEVVLANTIRQNENTVRGYSAARQSLHGLLTNVWPHADFPLALRNQEEDRLKNIGDADYQRSYEHISILNNAVLQAKVASNVATKLEGMRKGVISKQTTPKQA